MYRILLVEDSEEHRFLTGAALPAPEFELVCATTVREAAVALETGEFDLALLDIMLPDGDGFAVIQEAAGRLGPGGTPVIFLTHRADIEVKVHAFNLGAEDYVVKPFDPLELRARIEGRLKKERARKRTDLALVVGPLRFNPSLLRTTLRRPDGKDHELSLTPIEFKILYLLASNEGKIFSRHELLHAVWGNNVHVEESNIYSHVSSLRKKLGPAAELFESLPRRGYRFNTRGSAAVDEAA